MGFHRTTGTVPGTNRKQCCCPALVAGSLLTGEHNGWYSEILDGIQKGAEFRIQLVVKCSHYPLRKGPRRNSMRTQMRYREAVWLCTAKGHWLLLLLGYSRICIFCLWRCHQGSLVLECYGSTCIMLGEMTPMINGFRFLPSQALMYSRLASNSLRSPG